MRFKNVFFVFIVIMILFGFIYTISGYGNKQTIRTKVTDKERITESNGEGKISSYYLIYT
jgi:hypothetical protein